MHYQIYSTDLRKLFVTNFHFLFFSFWLILQNNLLKSQLFLRAVHKALLFVLSGLILQQFHMPNTTQTHFSSFIKVTINNKNHKYHHMCNSSL